MRERVEKFLKLFDGYEKAYGQHRNLKADESGKVNGNGDTVKSSLENDVVEKHLNGKGDSLGIFALREDNTVKFACIDIDIHHPVNPIRHTIQEIEKMVIDFSLPLVVCQSKSKGVHLYLFLKTPVKASIVIKKMQEWSVLIGYGAVEKFPKHKNREKVAWGNWLNMPYYDCDNTVRYAINKGKQLNFEEFIDFAELMRVSEEEISNFKIENEDKTFDDAPPCLQTLSTVGISEGSRNEGIFNFAVYFKKKYPDGWQDKIMELNYKIFKPHLKSNEVESIVKGLHKKDYFYKCEAYPICQYCNKEECHSRKYGIGRNPELNLEIDSLTKHTSDDSVIWYATIGDCQIQLTTAELFTQRLLQIKIAEHMNKVFQPMKSNLWLEKINKLMASCINLKDPKDASKKGQFKELLDSFLTEGGCGEEKSDLLKQNTYLDKQNNVIYFRGTNLFTYLKNKKFTFVHHDVWHWLRELDVEDKQLLVGNKRIRVWYIPAPTFYEKGEDERV
jgi:hypothetical protein